ncbi:Uncharacterized protein DAT39_003534, partial [Clarias magur]
QSPVDERPAPPCHPGFTATCRMCGRRRVGTRSPWSSSCRLVSTSVFPYNAVTPSPQLK